MELNFFLIFIIFIVIYLFLKKFNFFVENQSYSSHKILGSENRSPIIMGGLFILVTISFFHSVIPINNAKAYEPLSPK